MRLLILACSQRKIQRQGPLRAIDRYDGPAFRVLRKHLREHPHEPLTVCVLSAKYGLIEGEREIPWYNCRLTRVSADRLRPLVLERAKQVLPLHEWQAVGVCAGKDYQSLLDEVIEFIPAEVPLNQLGGGLGKRLAALRNWLRQERVEDTAASQEARRATGHERPLRQRL